jgi:hypothetical protein
MKKTSTIELYLEQALEYVQMVDRNITTDPRYMLHQAETRIQSALNIVRNEGFKSTFAEVAKHADLVARVKRSEVAQYGLRKAAQQALEALEDTITVPCYLGHPKQEEAANALREALK